MDTRREELRSRLAEVRERIRAACADAGRDEAGIGLVVVTKFFPAQDVERLVQLGVTDIGENRDQEAGPKVDGLGPDVRERLTVHFIGQLQTNKANRVSRYADVVQSLDRPRLVTALDRGVTNALGAGARHTPLSVTLQVDLGEGADQGRGGALPDLVPDLADQVADAEHLRLRGLMAVAPHGLGPDATRAAFDRLAALGERVRADHPEATWCSAGMSGDLEPAVAAGATHLRVGTAILGSRPSPR